MLQNAHKLGNELVLKAWTVARAPDDCPFVTADHPYAVVASEGAQEPLMWEEPEIVPPGYETWVPLSRRSLLIIGHNALSGRYIRFDEAAVRTANVMVAAQCERFFMSGDETQLMRAARELPPEIDNGWTLPGSLDLSRYSAPGPDRSVGRPRG